MEFALSPDCVELADDTGSYQFLVIDNAQQPEAASQFGLTLDAVWDGYDFAKAVVETTQNVEDVINALGDAATDGRFKTAIRESSATEGFIDVICPAVFPEGGYIYVTVNDGNGRSIVKVVNFILAGSEETGGESSGTGEDAGEGSGEGEKEGE